MCIKNRKSVREVRQDNDLTHLKTTMFIIECLVSSTASSGTTNCGVLTLIAICLSTTSHCPHPMPSPTAWVAQTPTTKPASLLVNQWKNCWSRWELQPAKQRSPPPSPILASLLISLAPLPLKGWQLCLVTMKLKASRLLLMPPRAARIPRPGLWPYLLCSQTLHVPPRSGLQHFAPQSRWPPPWSQNLKRLT